MKKVILALLSVLIVVSCCMPIMADDSEVARLEREQKIFNITCQVTNYLAENLDPSCWGTLTFSNSANIVIGVPDTSKIPEIEKALETAYKKFKVNGYGGNLDFSITPQFTSCKYSYKKLESILESIQNDPVMKKSKNKIDLSLGFNGFIGVNTVITDPAIKELLLKYKSIILFNQEI